MMPIVDCMRQGRSSRVYVFLDVSALGPVARSAVVDATYYFIGRMTDEKGLQEIGNVLILPREATAICPVLAPGEFLFRGPKWPDAALARIYANVLPPLRHDVHYETLPYVPSRSLREMPSVLQALQKEQAAHKAARLIPGQTSKSTVSGPVLQFLSLACDMVGFPATPIFEAMGNLPSSVQAAIRKKLEIERLALFETWRIERTTKLLQEVTQDGASAVGKPLKGLEGRGSTAHRNGMWWVKNVGTQRGYRHSETEFQVGDSAADNAWFNEGFRDLRLFEIVHTCYSNLPGKIRAAFASKLPIEQFTIIAAQKSMLQQIDLLLRAELGMVPYADKIHLELITPYLDAFLKGQRK
jgi:hypothetical protein